MMSNTREKLLEAKYFLERIIEKQSERDVFRYNLSAFLAAARSITLIMQAEFDKVSGFKEWYSGKQGEMKQDPEMKLLNEKRRVTIHMQPVRPSAQINATFTEHIGFSDSISITVTKPDGTVEQQDSEPKPKHMPNKREAEAEYRWNFNEFPDKDVVTLCQEHIAKLEAVVKDCESKFYNT